MPLAGDRDRQYEPTEITEMLQEAKRLGFSLEKGSELEHFSLADLERLLKYKQ